MAFANHVIPTTKSHIAHHFHHQTTLPHSFDSLYIILLIVPMTEHTSSDPLTAIFQSLLYVKPRSDIFCVAQFMRLANHVPWKSIPLFPQGTFLEIHWQDLWHHNWLVHWECMVGLAEDYAEVLCFHAVPDMSSSEKYYVYWHPKFWPHLQECSLSQGDRVHAPLYPHWCVERPWRQ